MQLESWFSVGPQVERGVSVRKLGLLLTLDADTGLLRWNSRPREMFERDRDWAGFEARLAGSSAINTPTDDGYLFGQVLGVKFRAHRVVFALSRGHWPLGLVDHENRCRTDNRPSNLLDSCPAANAKNLSMFCTNTTGFPGVSWHRRSGRWQAQIGTPGPGSHLGYFSDMADAIGVRRNAEIERGYAKGHGSPQPTPG